MMKYSMYNIVLLSIRVIDFTLFELTVTNLILLHKRIVSTYLLYVYLCY